MRKLVLGCNNRSFRNAFAAMCLMACGSTAFAQGRSGGDAPAADTAGQKLHTINEVVVTGQYAPASQDKAVQKIRVIDRKKIDAMSAQNLRDVLTNEMNIRISQDNVLGSGMSMQGIGGQGVKILIDGVPVIGRLDGNIDLSQINMNNIARIEIIEGPMAVSYGTDALAGTINLITKKTLRNQLEAGATTYYESIGTYNVNTNVGMHKGRHTLSLTGGRNYFDGWNPNEKTGPDLKAHIADSSRVQQWKPREQYMAGLQYAYKTGNTTINYKGDYFNELIINKGMPAQPYGENAFDDYYRTRRIDNAVFLNSALSRDRNINVLVAYNDYQRVKNTYYNDLTKLDRELTTNDGDQDTSKYHSLTSRGTYSTSKASARVNYEAGYDVKQEDASGARIDGRTKQMGDYAAFASAEYKPIQQLTLRPGLRYGYNTAYSAPLVPSLNLRYTLSDALSIRASYAKGFRAPSLKELYFYFVDINHNIKGNDALRAEYSDNYSLSAVYTTKIGGHSYKAEGGAYYNNMRDLITLAQTIGTEYTYINVGKYMTKGIQANVDAAFGQLKISVGGSYLGTYNQLSETQPVSSFSYSAEVRGNVFYEFRKPRITVAAFYKYTGRMPGFTVDAAGGVLQTYIAAYNTADVSVSKPFFDNRLNVAVGCKNLFDVTNVASVASGGAHSTAGSSVAMSCGRLYFVKAAINLKKK